MEDISGYGSSPERTLHRPPPPSELHDYRSSKRAKMGKQTVQLPPVIPVTLREDKYLVHVRLPISHPQLSAFVKTCLGAARLRLVGAPIKASFTELDDLHISISRPVTVRSTQIGMLVQDLRSAFAKCGRLNVVLCSSVVAFANENGRRVFVACPVAPGMSVARVIDLVHTVDAVFKKEKLPEFFDDPKPHMSFAWTETAGILPSFVESADDTGGSSLEIAVDKIVCSIGKSSYYFTLT